MRFRNSLRLVMENFKQVFRLLFIRIIILVAAVAVCSAFVSPKWEGFVSSSQFTQFFSNVKEFFKSLFALDLSALESIRTQIFSNNGSLNGFLRLLGGKYFWVMLGLIIVYLVKRFAETICYFTTGSILNDKMTTYAETHFGTAFIANLGKASMYAAIYVPVVFIIDVFTLSLCYFCLAYMPIFMSLYSTITVIVLCQALKLTLTGRWMPRLTNGINNERKDLQGENLKRQTVYAFANYIVTVYLMIIFNVIAAICTLGSALIITVPASFYMLICTQYVSYYTENGKKYFITYERIAQNDDCGDREHFFDYMLEKQENMEGNNTEKEGEENGIS